MTWRGDVAHDVGGEVARDVTSLRPLWRFFGGVAYHSNNAGSMNIDEIGKIGGVHIEHAQHAQISVRTVNESLKVQENQAYPAILYPSDRI